MADQLQETITNIQSLRRNFYALMAQSTHEQQQVQAIIDRMLDARSLLRSVTTDEAEFAVRVESIDRVLARCQRRLTLREKATLALELRFEAADATLTPAARTRIADRLAELQQEMDLLLAEESQG